MCHMIADSTEELLAMADQIEPCPNPRCMNKRMAPGWYTGHLCRISCTRCGYKSPAAGSVAEAIALHNPIAVAVREAAELRADDKALRKLIAVRSGIPHPYMDDGEASGGEFGIDIDFIRDSVSEISEKLRAIGSARLALWAAKDVAAQGRVDAVHQSSSARADYWRERAEKAEAERESAIADRDRLRQEVEENNEIMALYCHQRRAAGGECENLPSCISCTECFRDGIIELPTEAKP